MIEKGKKMAGKCERSFIQSQLHVSQQNISISHRGITDIRQHGSGNNDRGTRGFGALFLNGRIPKWQISAGVEVTSSCFPAVPDQLILTVLPGWLVAS